MQTSVFVKKELRAKGWKVIPRRKATLRAKGGKSMATVLVWNNQTEGQRWNLGVSLPWDGQQELAKETPF